MTTEFSERRRRDDAVLVALTKITATLVAQEKRLCEFCTLAKSKDGFTRCQLIKRDVNMHGRVIWYLLFFILGFGLKTVFLG